MSDAFDKVMTEDEFDAALAAVTPVSARQPKSSNKRQKQALIACRVLPEDRAYIEAAAHRRGLSLSSFMRQAALTFAMETKSAPSPNDENWVTIPVCDHCGGTYAFKLQTSASGLQTSQLTHICGAA